MPLDIGAILNNRYRILEIIAQGGMGAIYHAVDERLNVSVAVKENLYSTEVAIRQFHREATILAGLRHPNLPRVIDHFNIPSQGQYLVMDYIDGEDLRVRLARTGTANERETVIIGAAICDALTYLHTRVPPIVHRDIKPGNIKITSTGQIFLVDFGLAKVAQSGQVTTTGAQALTPGYAPPEQYGQGTIPLSDIYALGATLYAILTGKIPEDSLSRAMGTATLTPIRNHNPSVGVLLAGVIEKAMAIAPDQRYPNADAFKQALLNANEPARRQVQEIGETRLVDLTSTVKPVETVPPPPPSGPTPQPSPLKKPRKRALVPAIILGLFIIAGSIIGSMAAFSAKNRTSPATATLAAEINPSSTAVVVSEVQQATSTVLALPSSTVTVQPTYTDTPTIESSPTIQPTTLGGGSNLLAFASDRSGTFQIYTINLDGSNLFQITNETDGACQPSWSPDGQRLVFTSPCRAEQVARDDYKGSALFIINIDRTGLTPLPYIVGGDFDPAWSPDGMHIAFSSYRKGIIPNLYILDLADMSVIRVSRPSSNDRNPAWSPDGKKIAFENRNNGIIMLADPVENANPTPFSKADSTPDTHPAWAPDARVLYYTQGINDTWLAARQLEVTQAEEIRITNPENYSASNESISHDGTWLVFERRSSKITNLFLITRNGSNLTQITDSMGRDIQPAWQPKRQ